MNRSFIPDHSCDPMQDLVECASACFEQKSTFGSRLSELQDGTRSAEAVTENTAAMRVNKIFTEKLALPLDEC